MDEVTMAQAERVRGNLAALAEQLAGAGHLSAAEVVAGGALALRFLLAALRPPPPPPVPPPEPAEGAAP